MDINLADEIKRTISVYEVLRFANRDVVRGKVAIRDERTPSAVVYEGTNSWYDYGSGRGGSVIDLYMELFGVDVKTAVNELANIAGLTGREPQIKREPLKNIKSDSTNISDDMTEAEQEFYFSRLGMNENADSDLKVLTQVREMRMEQNSKVFGELFDYCRTRPNWKALDYLFKVRKFSQETVDHFRHFTINNYSEVNNHMKKAFDLEILQKSGLFNVKEDGSGNMIFFKHLLLIPFLFRGKIVYMRGRYFDQDGNIDTEKGFKYLGLRNDLLNVNTPKRFYNIDLLDNLHKGGKIYITEGEYDANAVYQMRYNAMAIPGATNIPSSKILKRLSDWVISICADNDTAGNDLTEKLGGALQSLDIDYSVKALPVKDANQLLMDLG